MGATVPGFETPPRAVNRRSTQSRPWASAGFEHRLFTQLSGGERQRTAIARALCQLAVALPAR